MSNSSQSPEEKPSLEESIILPKTKDSLTDAFDDDIAQANHFPVITIVLSLDDPAEPNHVDLGSIPPQIAAAAFRSLSVQLEKLSWPSKVSYAGQTIFDPSKLMPEFDEDDFGEPDTNA